MGICEVFHLFEGAKNGGEWGMGYCKMDLCAIY
jgi:hypothetical protein